MKKPRRSLVRSLVVQAGSLIFAASAGAQVTITDFNNFTSDALYPSWDSAIINSGPTSYDITSIGYGSNYKYIGFPAISGAGYLDLQLTVTLEGPPAADGHLGPIVTLIDADGTRNNYAWWGQPLGSHVLTMAIGSPSWSDSPGTTPGLDCDALQHMHMQLDPGGFGTSGIYTIKWEDLSLVNLVPEPTSFALLALGGAALAFLRRRGA
jgi:hypothetical protein